VSRSADSAEFSRKRPWLAVLLTVIIPGLGHFYLRLWGRAILWLGLSMLTSFVFVPSGTLPESFSVDAIVAASQSLSTQGAVVLFGISALCVVDVILMTRHINDYVTRAETEGIQHCPNCGKEIDGDLDFCHWCTTEIGEDDQP
jgi:predicted nucleic acid-binding Zn ribbon protein